MSWGGGGDAPHRPPLYRCSQCAQRRWGCCGPQAHSGRCHLLDHSVRTALFLHRELAGSWQGTSRRDGSMVDEL